MNFIEGALPTAGDIGKRVLQQTDPLSLQQELAALFLLRHLQGLLGMAAVAVPASSRSRRYDIEVQLESRQVARIEVYSPVDFVGLQRLEAETVTLFKYLDVYGGFTIELALETVEPFDVFYAYEVGDQDVIREWLRSVQKEAVSWLSRFLFGQPKRTLFRVKPL